MNKELFELELNLIFEELNGIVLDNDNIKKKYDLNNIDSYVIAKNGHIFIKYNWDDTNISIKVLEEFLEDCNKINKDSLKLVINTFNIDYTNINLKIISERSFYKILKKVDESIHNYLAVLYYSKHNYVHLDYIK
jgi:hypothetical protein